MAVGPTPPARRNPGPSWGFAFLNFVDDLLPRFLMSGLLWVGSAAAVRLMPERRRHSEEYLVWALGRQPRFRDVVRHFTAFAELLMTRLRVSRGQALQAQIVPTADPAAVDFLRSTRQGLFGTFHFGHSDLLGFLLTDSGRRVAMVRTRLGNSEDTEKLAQTFAATVNFVWVDDPSMTVFAIKESVDQGLSIAMQCDRVEFSSRLEAFDFLGQRRQFPFTIYHLSLLLLTPVVFCIGVPASDRATAVYASPIFQPVGRKAEDLAAAKAHYETVLRELEALIRQHPYLWFNFLPLNPPAVTTSPASGKSS